MIIVWSSKINTPSPRRWKRPLSYLGGSWEFEIMQVKPPSESLLSRWPSVEPKSPMPCSPVAKNIYHKSKFKHLADCFSLQRHSANWTAGAIFSWIAGYATFSETPILGTLLASAFSFKIDRNSGGANILRDSMARRVVTCVKEPVSQDL